MTLSGLTVQWEWEGDKGVWQQYPIDVQQEISQALENGNKEVVNNFNISYRKVLSLSRSSFSKRKK